MDNGHINLNKEKTMAKKEKKQVITINDKQYDVKDLSEEQLMMVNHVHDLDNKLRTAQFNVDQMQGGRNYFMSLLEKTLDE
tara:strand:- start:1914 stop:2156 length:243 start_codon:yes stop_codon:yes gene_type:complete